MSIFSATKSKKVISVVAGVLSVAFALLIVGPVFTSAQAVPSAPEFFGPGGDPSGAGTQPTYDPASYFGPGGAPGSSGTLPPQKDQAATGAQPSAAQELAAAFTCGLTNLKGCVATLMDLGMWMAARTLWIAGILLNITLEYTLNLNTLLEKMPIVDIGWKVLRDLANIVFIFITLWCGISITLGIGDDGKKAWGYLAQIVLVALFINFSLFIAKAVVDASNVASLHFYSLIVEPGKEKTYDSGLSEAFLYGLKLSTLYNSKQIGSGAGFDASKNSLIGTAANGNVPKLSFANIILIGFFGSLFIIVTAWVFFAAAIMFIYRAITLIILMMLSPLAFVGLILPGASGMAHAWWSKLWSQAFFAPLYLALAYVVVRTINAPAFQGALALSATQDGANFAAALTGTGTNSIAIIFNFIILIGLMVGCLIVAESLGAKGSDMAMAGFEKIKGGALGIAGATVRGTIKAPSAALRGAGSMATGGATRAVGNWMANSRLLNNKMMRKIGVSDWASRKSQEYGEAAKKMQGSKFNQIINKGATMAGNALDVRHLEERAGESILGNTFLGKAVRSVTTGALANAPIAGKSLQEAYEETQHDKSARNTIRWLNQGRAAGAPLKELHAKQNEKQKGKFEAEKNKKAAGDELEKSKELTPEEQTKVAEAQTKLDVAKAGVAKTQVVTPGQQARIDGFQGKLAATEQELTKAKASGAYSSSALDKLEAAVKTAREDLAKAKVIPPPPKALTDAVAEAEAELTAAKNPPRTEEQKAAEKKWVEYQEVDKELAEHPTDPDLQKKKREAREALAPQYGKLADAAEALKVASEALETFDKEHGKEMEELTNKKQEAYAQISSKEYVDFATKEDLINLMDFEHMPLGHYNAVMEDEHRLTEAEKETASLNFLHRLIEISKRGETRNEWFNENIIKYQKFLNKQSALLKRIAPELTEEIEKLKKELSDKIKEKAEEEKKKKKKEGE